jgi:uncharacterized delta-60 repeat protein
MNTKLDSVPSPTTYDRQIHPQAGNNGLGRETRRLSGSPLRWRGLARYSLGVLLVGTFLGTQPIRAADGDVDPTFHPDANDVIETVATETDGQILVGGTFKILGHVGCTNLGRLTSAGYPIFTIYPRVNGRVATVAAQKEEGGFLIGGAFTNPNQFVARFIGNGLDYGFNPDPDGFVYAAATQTNGAVVIGGEFRRVGGEYGPTLYSLARYNSNGAFDSSFDAVVRKAGALPTIACLAVQADGKILLGGAFTSVGGVPHTNIARLNTDGSPDNGFSASSSGSGGASSGTVNCIVVQANGKILLGGSFASVNGVARNSLARLNSDGTLDTAFNPTLALVSGYSYVRALALQADGKILVGGAFTSVGGIARNHIARLNADASGTLDTSFTASVVNGSLYDPHVTGLAVQANGEILVTGWFTNMNGTARNCIARLLNGTATQTIITPDATQVQWLRSGTAPEVEQVTFDFHAPGTYIWTALGSATRITGGWALTGLSLPPSGSIRVQARTAMNNYGGVIEQVSTFATPANLGVMVDGTNLVDEVSTIDFGSVPLQQSGTALTFTVTNAGGTPLTMQVLHPSGSGSEEFLVNTNAMAATVAPGGSTTFTVTFRPLLGGTRTASLRIDSNDPANPYFHIALSGTGVWLDPGFDPNANGDVYAMVVKADGKIMVGGAFSSLGGVSRTNLARLNADGTLDTSFALLGAPNGAVNCALGAADGGVVLGGAFTKFGVFSPTTRNRLARLTPSGTLDSNFDPDANNVVYCLAVQNDKKLLLGGDFTTIGGTTRNHIARLNLIGSGVDTSFNPNVTGTVYTMAVQTDGKILVGGSFTQVGTTVRTNLARLTSSGAIDSSFAAFTDGAVYAIVVQPDGQVLIGGNFTNVNGSAQRAIARLSSTGVLDTSLPPGMLSLNGMVRSLALQADGRILLGGTFTTWGELGPIYHYRITRLFADGTVDTGFTPGANGSVSCVALQPEGEILLGGAFTAAGGATRNHIARLMNESTWHPLVTFGLTNVVWHRGGTVPEVQQVTFDLSTDGGSSWTSLGSGIRDADAWYLDGLTLPVGGMIRARGRATGGMYNGSSSLIEQVASYDLIGLHLVKNGNGTLTVWWSGGGTLMAAPTVAGSWQDVVGATSPYTISPTSAKVFLRVRQ